MQHVYGSFWVRTGSRSRSRGARFACVQAGLAVWRVMQAKGAGELRRVLQALAGKNGLEAAPVAASMMIKLFSLKEMTGF